MVGGRRRDFGGLYVTMRRVCVGFLKKWLRIYRVGQRSVRVGTEKVL